MLTNKILGRRIRIGGVKYGDLKLFAVSVRNGWFSKESIFVCDVETFLNLAKDVLELTSKDFEGKEGVEFSPTHELQAVKSLIIKSKLEPTLRIPSWAQHDAILAFAKYGEATVNGLVEMRKLVQESSKLLLLGGLTVAQVEEMHRQAMTRMFGKVPFKIEVQPLTESAEGVQQPQPEEVAKPTLH